jgi:hypothetical protein
VRLIVRKWLLDMFDASTSGADASVVETPPEAESGGVACAVDFWDAVHAGRDRSATARLKLGLSEAIGVPGIANRHRLHL